MDNLIPLVKNTSEPLGLQDKILQHAQVKKPQHELLYAFIAIPESRPIISNNVYKKWFDDTQINFCISILLTLYRQNKSLESHEAHQDICNQISKIDFSNIVGEYWEGSIHTIKKDYQKRRLREVNLENQEIYMNPHLNVNQKITKVNASIMQLHDEIIKSTQKSKKEKLADLVQYTTDCMQGDIKFISWGIAGLDKYIKLRPNCCYFVGALPGTGKTAFAISAMIEQLKQGKRVFFWCAEMTETQIYLRFLSHITEIPLDILEAEKAGKTIPEDIKKKITNAINDLLSWDLHTACGKSMTFSEISSEVRTIHSIKPLDCAWFDYYSNIEPDLDKIQAQRHEQMAAINKDVEQLKHEISTPLVLLAQIKRDAVDRYPKKTDLAESSSCEKVADGIILIDRPIKGRDTNERNYWINSRKVSLDEIYGKCVLIVGKNRHGAERDSVYNFNPALYKFLGEDEISLRGNEAPANYRAIDDADVPSRKDIF